MMFIGLVLRFAFCVLRLGRGEKALAFVEADVLRRQRLEPSLTYSKLKTPNSKRKTVIPHSGPVRGSFPTRPCSGRPTERSQRRLLWSQAYLTRGRSPG